MASYRERRFSGIADVLHKRTSTSSATWSERKDTFPLLSRFSVRCLRKNSINPLQWPVSVQRQCLRFRLLSRGAPLKDKSTPRVCCNPCKTISQREQGHVFTHKSDLVDFRDVSVAKQFLFCDNSNLDFSKAVVGTPDFTSMLPVIHLSSHSSHT